MVEIVKEDETPVNYIDLFEIHGKNSLPNLSCEILTRLKASSQIDKTDAYGNSALLLAAHRGD